MAYSEASLYFTLKIIESGQEITAKSRGPHHDEARVEIAKFLIRWARMPLDPSPLRTHPRTGKEEIDPEAFISVLKDYQDNTDHPRKELAKLKADAIVGKDTALSLRLNARVFNAEDRAREAALELERETSRAPVQCELPPSGSNFYLRSELEKFVQHVSQEVRKDPSLRQLSKSDRDSCSLLNIIVPVFKNRKNSAGEQSVKNRNDRMPT